MIGFGSLFGKKNDTTVLTNDPAATPTVDPVVMSMGSITTPAPPPAQIIPPLPAPPMPPISSGGMMDISAPAVLPAPQIETAPELVAGEMPSLPAFDLSSFMEVPTSAQPVVPEPENDLGIGGMKIEDKNPIMPGLNASADAAVVENIIHGIPSLNDMLPTLSLDSTSSEPIAPASEPVAVLPSTQVEPEKEVIPPTPTVSDSKPEPEPEPETEPEKIVQDVKSAYPAEITQKVEDVLESYNTDDEASIKVEEDRLAEKLTSLKAHQEQIAKIEQSIEEEKAEIKKEEDELTAHQVLLKERRKRISKVISDLA